MSDLTEFLLARIAEDDIAVADRWRWEHDEDRDRLRRETEAKRRMAQGCVESQYGWILRELAAVYADHPDYREEWRP